MSTLSHPDSPPAPMLVLASGSRTRAAMLERAGLTALLDRPAVDEDEVKAAGRAENVTAEIVAEALAELKAQRITRRHPGALVVGADQMLECEGRWFDKPTDRAGARDQLLALRGRTHRLISCAVVVRDGQRMWHRIDSARLTMRSFSDAFLDDYLDRAGDEVLQSVGAYQLEGLGAQLFHRVEGDFFTILGLPLLPLLGFLRVHGVGRE
ncbi:septum formation protein [Azospirillum picis]|uniref:Nucleoside triphosphate pyrophosphatase n=2 Tax=Azospirillum picis TaxID=488438 RepID=A0ABU0MLQ3_9PROT|nr:septum formation protein [Azospirillum picis]MDQ0534179.1 septum formation protein [Azospirillum picis]